MKKFLFIIMLLFSFFFMKNSVFAETKTCKYSLSWVTRSVVSFDDYGKAKLETKTSQIADFKDQNLIMTITDPSDGNINSLTMNLTFSTEGGKFSIDTVKGGYNADGPYDIYG